MSSQEREHYLNNLLVSCRNVFEEIARIVPDLEFSATIPEEQQETLVARLDELLLDLKAVEGALSDATLEGVQSIGQEPLKFYRETLIPHRADLEVLQARLLDSQEPLNLSDFSAPLRGDRVRSILKSSFQRWMSERENDPALLLEDLFLPDETERVERLLRSNFFKPDDWLRNADDVRPVLGEAASTKLNSSVRLRLREIYQSSILDNHIASIALARSVLEYSLIDRATKIGIDPRDPKDPERTKPLREMVDDASRKHPQLRVPMESIVDAGNEVLHPKKKDNLLLLPVVLRKRALEAIEAIRTVVEALYL